MNSGELMRGYIAYYTVIVSLNFLVNIVMCLICSQIFFYFIIFTICDDEDVLVTSSTFYCY